MSTRTFSHRNQSGPSFTHQFNATERNVSIVIELKHVLSSMSCTEETIIRQFTPLVSIVKLAHGNIGSKGNTTCMWNQSKLCTIYQTYLVHVNILYYHMRLKKSSISLKF